MKLEKHNWTYLFVTNFFGVFNDNFLKHCIIFIAIGWNLPFWMTQSQLISLVAAALVIPYLIFSPLAGKWARNQSKQKVWQLFKLLELPIMLLASVAFIYQWVWLAVISVLLMGIQSSMYSPSKYGLIRDVAGPEGVSFGSGVFETMAFLGILIGSVAAPFISDHYNVWLLVGLFLLVAIVGYFTSLRLKIKELPEEHDAEETVNPLVFLIRSYKFATGHKYLNSAVLGSSIFWMIGGLLQMNVVIYCRSILNASNTASGVVLCCAAVGIALGCTVAGLLGKKTVRPQLIPIGLVGMIFALIPILIAPLSIWLVGFLIFVFAFMGGFFEVPSMALVQHANLGRKLGDVLAYLNLVNFLLILVGTGLFSVTTSLTNDNSIAVFWVLLLICLMTLLYFALRHPEFFKEHVKFD
jgi:MFS family permease